MTKIPCLAWPFFVKLLDSWSATAHVHELTIVGASLGFTNKIHTLGNRPQGSTHQFSSKVELKRCRLTHQFPIAVPKVASITRPWWDSSQVSAPMVMTLSPRGLLLCKPTCKACKLQAPGTSQTSNCNM